MTREGNTEMRGEENTGMTEDETTGTFIFESKLHSRWSEVVHKLRNKRLSINH